MLTLMLARQLVESVVRQAENQGYAVTAAAVDCGGNLVALHRMDGCITAGIDSAIGKAFTSAATGADTDALHALTGPGQPLFGLAAAVTYPRPLVPMPGAVPIVVSGELVGGLGVGGAPESAIDHNLAAAALLDSGTAE